MNPTKMEERYIRSLLTRDFDGQLFVDFLSQQEEMGDLESYIFILKMVKENIERR